MLMKFKNLWAWLLYGSTDRPQEEWLNRHYLFEIDRYAPADAGSLPAAPDHRDHHG